MNLILSLLEALVNILEELEENKKCINIVELVALLQKAVREWGQRLVMSS